MTGFVVLGSALMFAVVISAGCGGGSSSPSPLVTVPFSSTDLRVGTGAQAANGNRLMVHYTGWLYDAAAAEQKGRQFDTSANRQPFSFVLGAREVIRGWDQGLVGMRVGGVRRLVIPPDLAYGSTGAGNGVIPPNATLVFEVELLEVS